MRPAGPNPRGLTRAPVPATFPSRDTGPGEGAGVGIRGRGLSVLLWMLSDEGTARP